MWIAPYGHVSKSKPLNFRIYRISIQELIKAEEQGKIQIIIPEQVYQIKTFLNSSAKI
jgi:hypothetical protein